MTDTPPGSEPRSPRPGLPLLPGSPSDPGPADRIPAGPRFLGALFALALLAAGAILALSPPGGAAPAGSAAPDPARLRTLAARLHQSDWKSAAAAARELAWEKNLEAFRLFLAAGYTPDDRVRVVWDECLDREWPVRITDWLRAEGLDHPDRWVRYAAVKILTAGLVPPSALPKYLPYLADNTEEATYLLFRRLAALGDRRLGEHATVLMRSEYSPRIRRAALDFLARYDEAGVDWILTLSVAQSRADRAEAARPVPGAPPARAPLPLDVGWERRLERVLAAHTHNDLFPDVIRSLSPPRRSAFEATTATERQRAQREWSFRLLDLRPAPELPTAVLEMLPEEDDAALRRRAVLTMAHTLPFIPADSIPAKRIIEAWTREEDPAVRVAWAFAAGRAAVALENSSEGAALVSAAGPILADPKFDHREQCAWDRARALPKAGETRGLQAGARGDDPVTWLVLTQESDGSWDPGPMGEIPAEAAAAMLGVRPDWIGSEAAALHRRRLVTALAVRGARTQAPAVPWDVVRTALEYLAATAGASPFSLSDQPPSSEASRIENLEVYRSALEIAPSLWVTGSPDKESIRGCWVPTRSILRVPPEEDADPSRGSGTPRALEIVHGILSRLHPGRIAMSAVAASGGGGPPAEDYPQAPREEELEGRLVPWEAQSWRALQSAGRKGALPAAARGGWFQCSGLPDTARALLFAAPSTEEHTAWNSRMGADYLRMHPPFDCAQFGVGMPQPDVPDVLEGLDASAGLEKAGVFVIPSWEDDVTMEDYDVLAARLMRAGKNPWAFTEDDLRAKIEAGRVLSAEDAGSWDPVGPWARIYGRVWATAQRVMALKELDRK